MTWKHIAAIALGAGVGIASAFTGGGAALIPLATLIVGGALGHAQGEREPKWDGTERRRERRTTVPPAKL